MLVIATAGQHQTTNKQIDHKAKRVRQVGSGWYTSTMMTSDRKHPSRKKMPYDPPVQSPFNHTLGVLCFPSGFMDGLAVMICHFVGVTVVGVTSTFEQTQRPR